jgi:hypothetical protein
MEHLSSEMEQQVQWRRHKVQELCSKDILGEIVQMLQVSMVQ